MLKRFRLIFALLGPVVVPSLVSASGAWNTYVRPVTYNQLVAGPDTVWCATEEAGVVAFDRVSGSFTSFTREPGGLASNRISSIAFDRSSRMWVGTRDAGVSRRDADGTWGLLNAFDGLPGLSVNTVVAEGDTLWIGTTTGLALWNGREIAGALPDGTGFSPFANNNVIGIAVRGDSLWVATKGGVYYTSVSGGLTTWTEADVNLPLAKVTALATDGVDVFAVADFAPWRVGAAGVWSVVGGINNVFAMNGAFGTVVASSDFGLYAWNGAGWSQLSAALSSAGTAATILAATRNPAGMVFAAQASGIYEQAASDPWPIHTPIAPPGNDMLNVILDGPRTYVSADGQGFGWLENGVWTNWFPGGCAANCGENFLDAAFPYGMIVDKLGRKWIGCWSSAMEVLDDSGPTPQFTHIWEGNGSPIDNHTWVWATAIDANDNHWFGMDTNCLGCSSAQDPIGIEFYDPAGNYVGNYRTNNTPGMAGDQVRALAVDNAGSMWVGYGGSGGVQRFNLPTVLGAPVSMLKPMTGPQNWNVFGVETYGDSIWAFSDTDLRMATSYGLGATLTYSFPGAPVSKGALHPLAIAPDGSAWVGTVNGIRVFHPNAPSEDFTKSNSPLASDEVRTIRIDPATGVVWIATTGGLNRYDPGYTPPPPPALAKLAVRVYPNPSLIANGIGVSLRVTGNGSAYSGQVYDLNGRMLRRLVAGHNGEILWDGRNADGALVRPGLYFVRVEAGGRSAVARVTLLR